VNDPDIKEILVQAKTIAVVGLSDSPLKPSNQVARYMQDAGYRIIPINPKYDKILGETCYPDLKSVPQPVDIVDIFRNPDHVLPIVEEAITLKPRVIWMQLGVVSEPAAKLARDHGIRVVMDRCIKIEHLRCF
jgi:hypothetical protein